MDLYLNLRVLGPGAEILGYGPGTFTQGRGDFLRLWTSLVLFTHIGLGFPSRRQGS